MLKRIALVSILALSLSGCGMISLTTDHSDHGMMGNNSSDYSSNDLMFAQMMIPHHQQAVDMGNLAETRADNATVKDLALHIRDEQAPEIEQMKGWLDAAGIDEEDSMMNHMGMGMLTDAEYADLEKATGKEFDVLYLKGMIKHHQGAISMATAILESDNEEVRTLGRAIVDHQKEQIVEMKQLLAVIG